MKKLLQDVFENPFGWVRTSHSVEMSRPVPDVESGLARRLAFDEPAPSAGTVVSQGHLRLFIPDAYVRVGSIEFGSGGSPLATNYQVEVQGAPRILSPVTGKPVRVLHASRENVQQLMDSLTSVNANLLDRSSDAAWQAGKRTAIVTSLGSGTLTVFAGALAGGPVGAGIGAGVAAAFGSAAGVVVGRAQQKSLDEARPIEDVLIVLLKYWLLMLDDQMTPFLVLNFYQDFYKNTPALRTAAVDSIQRVIYSSLTAQLTEIMQDDGRVGNILRNGRAVQHRRPNHLQVERVAAFAQPAQVAMPAPRLLLAPSN